LKGNIMELPSNVSQWNVDHVLQWMDDNGFGDHKEKFHGKLF